jgi:hypothetical protein
MLVDSGLTHLYLALCHISSTLYLFAANCSHCYLSTYYTHHTMAIHLTYRVTANYLGNCIYLLVRKVAVIQKLNTNHCKEGLRNYFHIVYKINTVPFYVLHIFR